MVIEPALITFIVFMKLYNVSSGSGNALNKSFDTYAMICICPIMFLSSLQVDIVYSSIKLVVGSCDDLIINSHRRQVQTTSYRVSIHNPVVCFYIKVPTYVYIWHNESGLEFVRYLALAF